MTVFAAYGGVFTLIVSVIAVGYQPPQPTPVSSAVANAAVQSPIVTPDAPDRPSVDELVATEVASNLAELTNMAIATSIANTSVSLTAKDTLAQTNDNAIVKPQIVQPTATRRDVITYVAKEGDTVKSVASSYGLNSETVKWANKLSADGLPVGKSLKILPVDGVLYTVRSGDTLDSLASTYASSKDRIVSFNNLEISGLKPGQQIVIPGGALPMNQRPGYVAPRISTSSPSFYGISAGGNGYAYGYCTYYAAARRAQLGKPISDNWGNAVTWAYFAAAQGYSVGSTPRVGAIMQNGGGYGHVAIVEAVNPGVSITISEMNGYRFGGGWNRIGKGDISWGQAVGGGYKYIY